MKNNPIRRFKTKVMKRGKQFILLLLIFTLLLNISACGKDDPAANTEVNSETLKIKYDPQSEELIIANNSTTLALRQYIYARLKTEDFITLDLSTLSKDELSIMVNELAEIWEITLLAANDSEKIIDKVIPVLEDSQINKISTVDQPSINFMSSLFNQPVYASGGSSGKFDSKTWAENFTKKYDELKGGQTIKQLANQLGTDAKAAYEQLVLAQEIINSDAMADADFYDKLTKIAQGTKTACKVGLFVGGAVITGGGSLSALAGSSVTLGQAGSLVLSGVDCIVDVAATSSSIILGEKNRVTVGFDEIKDILAPITAVIGFNGLNLKDTAGSIDYIGNSLVDWFYENKIMGIKIDDEDEATEVVIKPIDIAEKTEVEINEIMTKEGFFLPEEQVTKVEPTLAREELAETYKSNKEEMIALLENLKSQLAKIVTGTEEVVENVAPGNLEELLNELGIETLTGIYDLVLTMTVVEVIYDSDDENNLYRAKQDDSWIGTRIESQFSVIQDGDTLSMFSLEEDEDDEEDYDSEYENIILTYNLEKKKWTSVQLNQFGKVILEAEVSSTADKINIFMLETASYENSAVPDGINQVEYELTKSK